MINVSKSALLAVLANALAAPLAVGLAFVLESAAIDYANRVDWQLSGWVLNLLPAALAGAAVYAVAAVITNRALGHSLTLRWIVRDSVPLTLSAVLVVLLLLSAPNNPDFWLFGQLLMWPLAALTSGIGCEVAITALYRHGSSPAAA